jgi:PAS domain S-box-containing protein
MLMNATLVYAIAPSPAESYSPPNSSASTKLLHITKSTGILGLHLPLLQQQNEPEKRASNEQTEIETAKNLANEAMIQRQHTIGLALSFCIVVSALCVWFLIRQRHKEKRIHAHLLQKNNELAHHQSEVQSALRLAEQFNAQLQAQNNSLNHVALVSITDLEGRILQINDNLCLLSGYRCEELIGEKHSILKSGLHDEVFYENLWKTIANGDTWRGEICNKAKNGLHFWTDTSIAPVLDEYGRPKQYLAIQFEISDRKQHEQELEYQKEKLAELNRLKDKLFSIVSHDFRSPLRSLKGALTLYLRGTISQEEMRALSSDLLEKLDITSNMLDNLLIWAKAQMHGMHVDPVHIHLKPLTDEVMRLIKGQAEKKYLRLINKINDNTRVYADLEMTKVIIRNLLTNAMKFSASDRDIVVRAKADKEHIEVAITDAGVGISEENVNKLFGLENYSTTGTANEKGMGLGLMLCKDFVNRNGGEIWVESKPKEGSTFYFTLPTEPVHED